MKNFYLGCDVSKGYADFVIIDDQKKIIEPNFQLDDTFSGHHQLNKVVKHVLQQYPRAQLYTAVESTGGYENNWYQTLKEISRVLPIKFARINPVAIKHQSQATMTRVTTDPISAQTIAEYQIRYADKVQYNQDDEFQTLRRFITVLRMLKKTKIQFANELETLLYTANSELIVYKKNNFPLWLLKLLFQYPDAKSLAQAHVQDLEKIAFITPAKAQELIRAAQTSVTSASDEMTRLAIITLVEQILNLETKIKQHTKTLIQHSHIPQISLLCTFTSIGESSAVDLLIELGYIGRFSNCKKIASFVGIHPVFKKSGDGYYGIHMSKQGRSKPRATLYMIALSAIQYNPVIKRVYQRELCKGKCRKDALCVCMHKILRIVYGMLKNNKPFDPEYETKRQLFQNKKSTSGGINSTRRYQLPDTNAPISSRQSKKRKERAMSQSDNITKYEIIETFPSSI